MSQCRTHLAVLLLARALCAAAEPVVNDADLTRVPPTEPTKALSTFNIRPGLEIQLVAAEPLVMDPIAIAFDAENRLFAVEMRDYSERAHERLGRIRLLEDTDGDGAVDKSAVFAEDLAWPTGVIAYDGGIFVIATPDILYLKDTDGDRKADVRKTIFTGLGTHTNPINVQQLANSLTWSIDNRIHVATGGNGGMLQKPGEQGRGLNVRSHDFSFDPRTLDVRLETGGGQYGITFDSFGRKFICNNSSHIRQVMYDQRYLVPGISTPLAESAVSIASDGPAATVYRTSPDEPWRVLRTKWRVAGMVPGPIEGGGRASGYFTSATGLSIFRGDALGSEFDGDAFVADCGSNLVHRKRLRPNGVEFIAERSADESSVEFLTSTDVWFRPVQLANGPDGALYIVDMYREVIEHPWSIPKVIKDRIDLNSGNDRGRIYRVVRKGASPRQLPNISKASPAELVQLLAHPNGWTRDTAARVLIERADPSAVRILRSARFSGPAKVQALYTLQSLNALTDAIVTASLGDTEPGVIENAIKLAESRSWESNASKQAADNLLRLRNSQSLRVQHQLIWSLPLLPIDNRWEFLMSALPTANDKWVRNAGIAALNVALENAPHELPPNALAPWVFAEYMRAAGAKRDPRLNSAALSTLKQAIGQSQSIAIAGAAAFISASQNSSSADRLAALPEYRKLTDAATEFLASGGDTSESRTRDAIVVVAAVPGEKPNSVLLDVLKRPGAIAVQAQALDAFLLRNRADLPDAFWSAWTQLTPQLRSRAIDTMLRFPSLMTKAITALDEEKISAREFSAANRETLRKHPEPRITDAYRKHFGGQHVARAEALEKYRPALTLRGNADAGRQTYVERCQACHRLRGEGKAVGPDFESIKANGLEYLLTHMIDPNREVASRYLAYSLQLRSGESFRGLIVEENSETVTIRDASGETRALPREFVHQLQASNQSLMPEGLEEGLTSQQVADLLAHILQ